MAAPSNIRQISGTVPGLLDPTQPERLLRLPGSKLHFAAFDPLAATARDVADRHKLSTKEELCRSRRIVIETSPGGDSFWRYVPNARLEDGVEDEGGWPRAIIICGELVQCSQDQWDIYKLDPLYACIVRSHPHSAQITRVTHVGATLQGSQRKRRASTPPAPSRKKLHNEDVDDGSDGSTIDEMVVDHLPRASPKLGVQKTPVSKGKGAAKHGSKRGANFERQFFSYTAEAPNDFLPMSTRDIKKRKQPDILESPSITDSEPTFSQEHKGSTYTRTENGKRARTVSPFSNVRLDSKKLKHEKSKRERREQESFARRQKRDKELFDTLVAEATCHMQENIKEKRHEPEPEPPESPKDRLRQAAIEESRRKIAELEADKPLWEAAAKARMVREEEERDTIRVRAESSRTKEKEKREREARIQEAEERKRKEGERLHKEEATRRERERRQRKEQRWAFGPWTTQRALDRYKILSEEFDSTKFCADQPLTMEAVPWPVLIPPARFSVADVDWGAVEKFFSGVKELMGAQDYKTFVEKSHRRFHPDRWRSRSLLKTVLDEMERDNMEIAANTVAQALTPIWRGVTGR